MRQTTYLNGILTLNAVLLAGVLWTQVASRPLLAQNADAQVSNAQSMPGIPNSGAQREQMIRHLDRLNRNLEATMKVIEGGKVKVEVTNLKDIKIEQAQEKD